MAKGDIFEPLFDHTIVLFFPSSTWDGIVEILSWPWLVGLIAFLVMHRPLRKVWLEISNEKNGHLSELKWSIGLCRYAVMFGAMWSLTMFRFGNSF